MGPLVQIILGVAVSLFQSFVDAFGLNLQKRSHLRNSKRVKPRNECMRIQWHLGLYLYIGSQILGSTVVLWLLKAQWAAPLGAVSLVFNFLFAYYLVGTLITRRDILGTLIVIASILGILFAGAYTQPPDELDNEKNLSIESLKANFSTFYFKIYFILLNIGIALAFAGCFYARWVSLDENRLDNSRLLRKHSKKKITRSIGVMMGIIGGTVASETLLLAKSGLILLFDAFNGKTVFTDPLSYGIVIFLAITAILQMYCLNAGIKYTDSVVVSPIFTCAFNVFGLSNTMFYFDSFNAYPIWYHLVSAALVLVLSVGVFILAFQEKEEPDHVPYYNIIGLRNRTRFSPNISEDNSSQGSGIEKSVFSHSIRSP